MRTAVHRACHRLELRHSGVPCRNSVPTQESEHCYFGHIREKDLHREQSDSEEPGRRCYECSSPQ